MSEKIVSFHLDLINALGNISSVIKSNFNPHFKSKYASISDVLELVRPILLKNNFALMQDVWTEDGLIGVRTKIIHISGESLVSSALRFPFNTTSPQALGSVISYLRRYQLLTFLCLSSEDDDGESVTDIKTKTIESAVAMRSKLKSNKEERTSDEFDL